MKYLIIDTREPFEYAASHVEGAVNISPAKFMTGEVPQELAGVAKNQPIIVYCRSGARSNTVSYILRSQGFTNITNGINEGRVEQLLKKEG